MQDKFLHDIATSFMLHEMELSEYRHQRSQYIDKITGYVDRKISDRNIDETNYVENDNIDMASPFQTSSLKKNVILILSLTSTLIIIIYSLFNFTNH